MNTLKSQGFYQKANVDSWRTEEQLTWSSQQDRFMRNARNRMWTSTWPLSKVLQKLLTPPVVRTLENYGKVWLSCQIHSNGATVPWWYACKGTKWWRVFRFILCDICSQARLCTRLFNMMFSAMLTDAFQDGDNGIPIRYRFYGKPFNLCKLNPSCWQRCQMSSSLLMTWQRVLQQKRKCKHMWIKYLIHVTSMISQSASKRLGGISASTW